MSPRGRSVRDTRTSKEAQAEWDRYSSRLRVFRLRVVAGPPEYGFGDEYEEVLDPERYEKYFPVKACDPSEKGVS